MLVDFMDTLKPQIKMSTHRFNGQ